MTKRRSRDTGRFLKSVGPCLPGATRLRGIAYQSLIFHPNGFSIFNQQLIDVHQFPLINQQLANQLAINLLFAGLQVSKLVIVTVYCTPGASYYLPPGVFSQLGVVPVRQGNSLKFWAISQTLKIIKLIFQDPKSVPNEVQTRIWNHQIHEKHSRDPRTR